MEKEILINYKIGETILCCNSLKVEIVKINEKNNVCYDKNGMWYALVNCKKIINHINK